MNAAIMPQHVQYLSRIRHRTGDLSESGHASRLGIGRRVERGEWGAVLGEGEKVKAGVKTPAF